MPSICTGQQWMQTTTALALYCLPACTASAARRDTEIFQQVAKPLVSRMRLSARSIIEAIDDFKGTHNSGLFVEAEKKQLFRV